jgi:UPF0755 protein
MARKIVIILFFLIATLGSLLFIADFLIERYYWNSVSGAIADDDVMIPAGASSKEIATMLDDAHVIDHAWLFRLYAIRMGHHRAYQAGEYRFSPYLSPSSVSQQMVDGKTIKRYMTIIEGWTSQQITDTLRDNPYLQGDITEELSEGSILPDTYAFLRHEKRQVLIRRMQKEMQQFLTDAWNKKQEGLPIHTPEEALILASVVEKETGVADERERVAAVFINRLRLGMKLQSDPTTNYGIYRETGKLKARLLRDDLAHVSPYNTYVIDGLPPTPICHPSRASIQAVLHPAKTEELYFVADGKGGHVFAETLVRHNRNVARYYKTLRQTLDKSEEQTK